METKPDVNTEDKSASAENNLPPCHEEVMYAELVESQIEIYKAILGNELPADEEDELNQPEESEREKRKRYFYLNKIMQLRKVCNHTFLCGKEGDVTDLETELIRNTGKMILLDALLTKLEQEKRRVLLFTQMTRMLDLFEDYCEFKRYKYFRMDGNTDLATRQKQVHEFTSPDSDKFIFLMSTRVGGVGVKLTSADTVILYDSDLHPKIDQMAIQRAHTIGQTKPVHVYRLITRNTIEERLLEYQRAAEKDHEPKGLSSESVTVDFLKEMIAFGSDIILNEREN